MRIKMESLRTMESLAYKHMDKLGYIEQGEVGVVVNGATIFFKAYGMDERGLRHKITVKYFEEKICGLTDEIELVDYDLKRLDYYED